MTTDVEVPQEVIDAIAAQVREQVMSEVAQGEFMQQLVAQAGLPAVDTSRQLSRPEKPWQKVQTLCERGGGAWDQLRKRTARYADCKHAGKRPYSCICWTEDREHRVKFSLGLCTCEPGNLEEPETGRATQRGDVVLEMASYPTKPRGPRRK